MRGPVSPEIAGRLASYLKLAALSANSDLLDNAINAMVLQFAASTWVRLHTRRCLFQQVVRSKIRCNSDTPL